MRQYGPQTVDGGILFSITVPDAKKVVLAGSFNQWDTESQPMTGPDESGKWSIVIPLSEGRYEYLFLVDGEKWLLDPAALAEEDGLGGKNSVIMINK
ncbi:MAG: glycogen-binding domain-containing protein [Nitrospirae bacterium]|nr:glycogen-binding domain-containing protein [Nitrospirota bacterium]